jgi:hypothetical protein
MFLRFFDKHFHDETTNHDSRRCGLPGDWMLFSAVGADARQLGGTAGGWLKRSEPSPIEDGSSQTAFVRVMTPLP